MTFDLPELRLSKEGLLPALLGGFLLCAAPKSLIVQTAAALCGLVSVKRLGNFVVGLDAFFTNNFGGPATVSSVMEFEDVVSLEVAREMLTTELVNACPRFRERIKKGRFLWTYAKTDEAFDINNHVYTQELPQPQGRDELMALASEHQNSPFDEKHPLWDCIVVNFFDESVDSQGNLKRAERTAFLVRFDHGLTDGVSIMRKFLLASDNQDISIVSKKPRGKPQSIAQKVANGAIETYRAILSAFLSPMDPVGPLKNTKTSTLFLHELPLFARFIQYSFCELRSHREALSDVILQYVSRTNLSWSNPIKLDRIKVVAKALQVSVNDVLLSCMSGMYGRLAYKRQERSVRLPGVGQMIKGDIKGLTQCNIIMWVSMRGLDLHVEPEQQMGNKIGCVYIPIESCLELPPVERLREVNRITTHLKDSVQPHLFYVVMSLLGYLPPVLLKVIYKASAFKGTISASNLPGPQTALSLRGHPVRNICSFTRAQGTIGFFTLLVSYNGHVTVGISADETLLRREDMPACFQAYEEELAAIEAEASKNVSAS